MSELPHVLPLKADISSLTERWKSALKQRVLEPGTCISLRDGEVLHITVGRVSVLNQMEDEIRQALLGDMDQPSARFSQPQFSVVLTGGKKEVAAAHRALPSLLKDYDLEIPGPSAVAPAAAAEEEETVEVEGLVMKSMERRERPNRKR
ncbi:hypothetical protein AK812_SmicGene35185 [Symbiodinium microadriaticum]|uniref:Uncharacterized protein n=1 Tax=Symbiodinium microadriaticum TaxID=2951 RepID=A0A1Q9CM93_SYMMI|nr:hypothetical protein AK812_SmicGene35185 [Symbiodinium microadriaticum]